MSIADPAGSVPRSSVDIFEQRMIISEVPGEERSTSLASSDAADESREGLPRSF
jgi:hypothetical protein